MKYIKLLTIIFSIFIFSNRLFAQDNIVKKSDVVKTINGKHYYIHTVKKGETIYSICKIYGISEKQLAVDNPDIFNGLKLKQELKIFKQTGRPLRKSPDYIYVKVEKKQTVYSITKKYKISQEQFYNDNPEAKNGLKVGQEIKIKKIKTNDRINHEVRPSDVPYLKHKVKRKETLYSISKKYKITQDDILKANPSIKDNGLKKGMIINIPTKEFINNSLWETKDTIKVKDSINNTIDTLSTNCTEKIFEKSEIIKIGLLLPFDLDIKTLNIEEKNLKTESSKRPKVKPFFEIYQGILIKLKELKELGYNIDLYAYDTKKSTYTVKTIMKKPEIKLLDFIIGPIYQNTFDTALKYKPINIPIINPLIDVSSKFNHKYSYIQTESPKEVIFNKITNYISNIEDINYIIISDGSEKNKNIIWKYSNELRKLKKDSITIHNVNFENTKKLAPFIDKTKNNVVVILSTKEGFVTNVVTKLHVAALKDTVILIGFKEWQKFKIQTEYYHKLNLTIFNNKNVNYTAEKTLNFNKIYKDEYNCEATRYSYIGYDIANLLITTYTKYKSNLCKCITNKELDGFIYKFKFKKIGNHFVNTELNTIKYKNDLTIEIK